MIYPKFVYRKASNEQGFEARMLSNEAEAAALEGKWFASPAEFGVETHPEAGEEKPAKSPLFKLTVEELKEKLLEKGVDKKALKGLKEADLVKLLEEQA